jgi:hypothetical protein
MTDQKTHWKKFHNPEYIGAYAFMPDETKVVTIKSARQESVQGSSGKKDDCLVVHFEQHGVKPLICNVTNSKTIAHVAGSSYIEDWVGVSIELFVTEVSAFGDTVEAVRVKKTAPKVAVTDPAGALKSLRATTTLDELKSAWAELSSGEKKHPDVMKEKETMKSKLTPKTPSK